MAVSKRKRAREEDPEQRHSGILSKYSKSLAAAEAARAKEPEEDQREEQQPQIVYDLKPLPQPTQAPEPEYVQPFSSLPSWLAAPIVVPADLTVSFADLGLQDEVLQLLKMKDYEKAFAVQAAVLPRLLQGPKWEPGDLCIAAPTGSGKTLSYVLPIVQDLKGTLVNKLRALIVVPTQDLVTQVRDTTVAFVSGTSLKIATATGRTPINQEQEKIVKKWARYDPIAYKKLQEKAKRLQNYDDSNDDDEVDEDQVIEDARTTPEDYVPFYAPDIDILICTPGRLVEHIRTTKGFRLDEVEWLVIDEADKLLDQDFQQWVSVVMPALYAERPFEEKGARDKLLSLLPGPRPPRNLRKIVLSATMTTDINKLSPLNFNLPKLVVVERTEKEKDGNEHTSQLAQDLDEFALPVDDGSEKPLYLSHLLQTKILDQRNARVLIFTNENENASRLARLLGSMQPKLAERIKSVTKLDKSGNKVLKRFGDGEVSIVVASDRLGRGIDVANLTDIINYDMPRDVTSYVHRVGRTARAGKEGRAWTFFTKKEGRWFWNEIARSPAISRKNKVQRLNLDLSAVSDTVKQTYARALEELQADVVRLRS